MYLLLKKKILLYVRTDSSYARQGQGFNLLLFQFLFALHFLITFYIVVRLPFHFVLKHITLFRNNLQINALYSLHKTMVRVTFCYAELTLVSCKLNIGKGAMKLIYISANWATIIFLYNNWWYCRYGKKNGCWIRTDTVPQWLNAKV